MAAMDKTEVQVQDNSEDHVGASFATETYIDPNIVNLQKDMYKKPYEFPLGFKPFDLDLNNPKHLEELSTLLNMKKNSKFPTCYSPEHLKWLLQTPRYNPHWNLGVRLEESNRMVACASAIPTKLNIWDTQFEIAHIIIFYVNGTEDKNKSLKHILMKEITRRVNLTGVLQLTLTKSTAMDSTLISSSQYFSRLLNPKKLLNLGYTKPKQYMSINETIELYKLPAEHSIIGFRRIQPEDMRKAYVFFVKQFKSFWMYPMFTYQEFQHFFTPIKGVIECFIVEGANGQITDITSFLYAPLSTNNCETLMSASLFYNLSTKTLPSKLMTSTLIEARNAKVDIFFATNVMATEAFLAPLKFKKMDVEKFCYIQNSMCPFVESEKMGMIFL